MNEQEKKDLEELHVKVKELKLSRIDYLLSMLRYTQTDFEHSGYRNGLHQALEGVVRMTQKDLDKIHKEYLKKYPDDH